MLEDDQIFLHHQERYLEASGVAEKYSQAFYLSTKADLYVSELRQWVNLYRADLFPNQKLSSALSKEQLLDRYNSHTKNCASCSQALDRLKKIKTIAIALAIFAFATIPLLNVYPAISDRAISIGLSATNIW